MSIKDKKDLAAMTSVELAAYAKSVNIKLTGPYKNRSEILEYIQKQGVKNAG